MEYVELTPEQIVRRMVRDQCGRDTESMRAALIAVASDFPFWDDLKAVRQMYTDVSALEARINKRIKD